MSSKMSKKSGKRSQSSAGNHFDKLLKVCSNSKVAGTLGRFGVTSFTSIRSTAAEPKEEKKPKSKYASFKKRARLDPAASKAPPVDPLPTYPPLVPPSLAAGSSSVAPPTTILKPRKFFKSRGPMEVEVGPNQQATKPFRPDSSNLIALLPPLPNPSMSPLIPSNTNTNSQYYSLDQNQSRDHHKQHKHHKKKGNKKLENLSSPPPLPLPSQQQGSDSSFSSVCSPPIKLRIFKDRGKFVAQTPVVTPDTPPIDTQAPKKRGRKPGSKSKKSEAEFSFEEQKPPKQTKRSKTAVAPPPPAPAARGRTTRNSSKRLESDSTEIGMPTLDREMRNSISSIEGLDTSGDMYPPAPATLMVDTCELQMPHDHHHLQEQQQLNNGGPPAVEIIKKLEEDADFKKLSEMLSSMESENAATSSSNQYSQNQHPQEQHHQQQIPSQDYNDVQSYQQQHNQGGLETYPVNLTSGAPSSSSQQNAPVGLSAFAAQAYMQQQFRQQMQQQPQQYHNQNQHDQHQQNLMEQQHQDDQNYYMPPVSNSNMDMESYRHHEHEQLQHHQHQQQMSSSTSSTTTGLPQQQHIPKANDIRSILVDDWDDFDDEQHSPRKPPSQSSQSPPKTSRFDMSAFMSGKDDSPSYPSSALENEIDQHHHQQQQQHHSSSSHVPDGMPRQVDYNAGHIDPHQQQQQLPFNIHSSPYAMRNLLNAQGDGFIGDQGQDSSHPDHDHQAPIHFPTSLVEQVPLNSLSSCAKQEAISVLDSVLKQQQLSNEIGNSQTSGVSSIGSNSGGANSQNLSQGSQKQQVAPSTRKASIFKSRANQNANGETGSTAGGNGTGKPSSKRLALYRHKFGQEEHSEEKPQNSLQPQGSVLGDFEDDFGDDDEQDLSLRKMKVENSGGFNFPWSGMGQDDDGVTKVTCKKEAKRLFTVVKNTKAVHQLQESGEFHEFDGDVQYILENLNSKNSMNIRCLSAITLATRCMEPSFRMHLRAHGTVAEFCVELRDSPQHPELALLAALVLFVLSQDRLNMDLDTDTLKLILALSKAEDVSGEPTQSQTENLETLKHHQKVLDLCVEMKNRGHATHLKLDRITASELALETLLHLTSKRAGEWVKHELRALGGLDSIVNEVDSCLRFAQVELVQFGWTEGALERLRKIDRCLQVLQQVTFNHEHNQKYLLGQSEREIEGGDGSLSRVNCVDSSPKIFVELFRFCKDYLQQLHMGLESAGVMREILFSVLRVLVNLSHDYRGIILGSEILLAIDGFLQLVLHSTFEMGHFFPDEKIFDLLMHSLCMLLNLVEHSLACRNAILTSIVQKSSAGNYRVPDSCGNTSLSNSSDDSGVDEEIPVLDAFVEMFLCRERAAKKEEQHTDNILTKGPDNNRGDSGNSSQKEGGSNSQDKNSQDAEGSSLQDTIDKLIQTAGKHMENSLIAAYIALLLAYLIMDNPTAANQVRISMPNGQYLPLMTFLKKLFNFMSITSSASGSIRGLKATAIALRFFSQADPQSDEELKRLIPD
ncbi:unnamed protein product [Orchesella dallaii]|uniref:WAPL domain-containing protein n=1 Tax=Orchesella dallaii TaxID=48710 RepID=A0ABP1Q7Z9_9HEXA